MDIKIKSDRITALLGGYYDSVYSKLKALTDGADNIFTQRTVWTNSVQWHLPGERWQRLSDADPMAASKIHAMLDSRKKTLQGKLAEHFNSETLGGIFTVPDDRFVYYNEDADSGLLNIKLVAWGYNSYREDNDDPPLKQGKDVTIRFINNGAPAGKLCFSVISKKGAKTTFETDDDGCYKFCNLPEGNNFTVEYDGKKYFVLLSGVSDFFDIDITPPKAEQPSAPPQPPVDKKPERPKEEHKEPEVPEEKPAEKPAVETPPSEISGGGISVASWITILLLALLVGGAFYAGWQLLFDSPFN